MCFRFTFPNVCIYTRNYIIMDYTAWSNKIQSIFQKKKTKSGNTGSLNLFIFSMSITFLRKMQNAPSTFFCFHAFQNLPLQGYVKRYMSRNEANFWISHWRLLRIPTKATVTLFDVVGTVTWVKQALFKFAVLQKVERGIRFPPRSLSSQSDSLMACRFRVGFLCFADFVNAHEATKANHISTYAVSWKLAIAHSKNHH